MNKTLMIVAMSGALAAGSALAGCGSSDAAQPENPATSQRASSEMTEVTLEVLGMT